MTCVEFNFIGKNNQHVKTFRKISETHVKNSHGGFKVAEKPKKLQSFVQKLSHQSDRT